MTEQGHLDTPTSFLGRHSMTGWAPTLFLGRHSMTNLEVAR